MEPDDLFEEVEAQGEVSLPSSSPRTLTRDQEVLKEFILTLEILPEIWDSSSKDYKNVIKKGEALQKLLEIYKKIKINATIDEVKKKINTLRSNYRKELKKILTSKRSGASTDAVYKPKSWVFHLLHFINKTEQPITQQATQSTSSEEQESQQENDKEEHRPRAFTSLNNPEPPKKQKKMGTISKQNELLDKACSFLSQSANSSNNTQTLNPTALYWTQKLEKLSDTQRMYAEKFINDILFEATVGNLTRDSVQINSPDNFITPSHTPSPIIRTPTPTPSSYNLVNMPSNPMSSQITVGNLSRDSVQINSPDNFITPSHTPSPIIRTPTPTPSSSNLVNMPSNPMSSQITVGNLSRDSVQINSPDNFITTSHTPSPIIRTPTPSPIIRTPTPTPSSSNLVNMPSNPMSSQIPAKFIISRSEHDDTIMLHDITQPQYDHTVTLQNVIQNIDNQQQQPVLVQYTEDESSNLVNMPSNPMSSQIPAKFIISRSEHDDTIMLHDITQPQYDHTVTLQNVIQNIDNQQQQPVLVQYTEDESSNLVNMPSSGVPAQLIISRSRHDTLHNITQPQYEQNVTQNIDTQITQPTQQQQTPSNLSSAKTQKTTIHSLFRSYRPT